jgi:Uma2 family endonuclease
MKHANVRFTYDDYLLLPEDKRYEILDGELCVVPAPNIRHQRIGLRLKLALFRYVEDHGLGEVFDAPCDVVLSDENVVQPDILFVCRRRHHIVGPANVGGAPDLAIEILSPARRNTDLGIKKKIYSRFGVQEYWIVDPDAATVEVLVWGESGYVSAGVCGITDRLSSPLLPELNLPLSGIFKKE